MKGADLIRERFERNQRALELKDSLGRGTAVTVARVTEGLTCEIEDGAWRVVADQGAKSGGADAGPNPGVLGRGALASCMAQCYVMWAAKLGIPIDGVEVRVEADYDARGELGVGDGPSDYSEIRCITTIRSDAPPEDIERLIQTADHHSPYLQIFERPQKVVTSLQHETGEG